MNVTIFSIALGLVIGGLDIVPMIKQKINLNYTVSAFIFHFIMPSIVNSVDSNLIWWQSAMLYFVLTLPLSTIIFKENKKDAIIMLVISSIIGVIVGIIFSNF